MCQLLTKHSNGVCIFETRWNDDTKRYRLSPPWHAWVTKMRGYRCISDFENSASLEFPRFAIKMCSVPAPTSSCAESSASFSSTNFSRPYFQWGTALLRRRHDLQRRLYFNAIVTASRCWGGLNRFESRFSCRTDSNRARGTACSLCLLLRAKPP